jgi:glycosyltransferase involved in cell wall biosynthesis
VGVGEELVQADFDQRRIHLIPNGTALQPPRGPAAREAARRALGEVNPDLKTYPETKIVLFLGRLRESNGLTTLVDAWPDVLAGCPEARLWLVGDGPMRDTLGDKIQDLQLQSTVFMPGSFDEVGDVLSAANVVVCPTPEPGMPLALLEAAAACLPIVAIDSPATSTCSPTSGENARLVPANDMAALGQAVVKHLLYPPPPHALLAARRCVQRAYHSRRMVDEHADLFQRLVR